MDILESLKKKKKKAYDLEYPTQGQSREPESFMGKISLPHTTHTELLTYIRNWEQY